MQPCQELEYGYFPVRKGFVYRQNSVVFPHNLSFTLMDPK